MLKNLAIATALTVLVGSAAFAQNNAPPDDVGKTNMSVPTGAATATGRSVAEPATAPVVVAPSATVGTSTETGGVKAGVGSTLNKPQ